MDPARAVHSIFPPFKRRDLFPAASSRGMTLLEVLIAAVVMVMAMVGILYSYIKCVELNALGQDVTLATQAVRSYLEEIKNTSYSSISSTYNNTTFTVPGLNGIGVVYVDSSVADLLEIKLQYSWRTTYGRTIGGDKNLNGTWQSGELKDAKGRLESYVQVVTKISG